ncbi:hypothetical protein DB345_17280 [Spartobacteria bacterium LR76]|nr:hypothetical protein DB345_17280 [Spartobacteria bacterium LR76]
MGFLIKIGSSADTSGIDKASSGLKGVAKEADKAGEALGSTGGRLGQAFSALREGMREIPVLGTVVDKLGTGLAGLVGIVIGLTGAVVAGFAKMISSGVEFNSTLENSQLGIAAVLKQFDQTGRFADFDAAMEASAAAIELLKQKAMESPASFDELVQAYQGAAGAMAASGMTIEQQIDTIVTMSQTLAGLGIQSSQILQETRAILTGNITEDAAAARILGITKEMIETAKEQGNLYEFLQMRTAAFAEAGVRSANTLTTKMSNLKDAFQQLSAELSKPAFEGFKQGLDDISKGLTQVKRLLDYLAPPKDAVADGLSEVAKAAQKAEQGVRELNQSRLESLKKEAADAAKSFATLADSIRTAAQRMDELDEASTKKQIAELDVQMQDALAKAGNDQDARARIQADFNAQRRAVQSGYEDRRLTRSTESEKQVVSTIEGKLAEKVGEATKIFDEEIRARQNTQTAYQKVKDTGVSEELGLAKGAEAAFVKYLTESLEAAQKNVQTTEAKWFGETGRMNPEQAKQETDSARSQAETIASQLNAVKGYLEAVNYQTTAEEKGKTAQESLDKYRAEAEPQIDKARQNISLAQIQAETQALQEQAALRKEAAETQEREDKRRIDSLSDQLALLREQNASAIADLRARGETEATILERTAQGKEQERDLELEIAKIRGESDQRAALAAEERLQDTLAVRNAERQAQEKADAESARENERKTRKAQGASGGGSDRENYISGRIDARAKLVRGAITSDAMDKPIEVGGNRIDESRNQQPGMPGYRKVGASSVPSPLDAYKADQPGMPGYTPIVPSASGSPVQPPGAAGPQTPAQASQPPGGGASQGNAGGGTDVKGGFDGVKGKIEEISKQTVEGLKGVEQALDQYGSKNASELSNLKSRVQALEQGR